VIALLQRVTCADVKVNNVTIGEIGPGILVFVGVERNDSEAQASRLSERLIGYRVFSDDQGKMNLSVRDLNGGILLVPQFTLAADTTKGTRASFIPAADPETGRRLFDLLVTELQRAHPTVATGQFGADMKVSLVNDGPVTFWLTA
jgi:D-tyrosyl-tRNA(Tyr) deacylase